MKLLLPKETLQQAAKTYERHCASWLAGGGVWPQAIVLGTPSERFAADNMPALRQWCETWLAYSGEGVLSSVIRRWPRLGEHTFPERLEWPDPAAWARSIGRGAHWQQLVSRYARLCGQWPALREQVSAPKLCVDIADYTELDFERLLAVVGWLLANPRSNVYLRELPIEQIDTKWIEGHVSGVTRLLKLLRPELAEENNFFALCGLRKMPMRVRLRVLCPTLREALGGLADVEAPLETLAQLTWQPTNLLVVENLASGLALPDMPGTVAIMKLGAAVSVLKELPWIPQDRVFYWGDLDTDGLVILSRARQALPRLRSLLMDVATLERYSAFWAQENKRATKLELPELTPEERAVYEGLCENRWGERVRLEQERIPWPAVEVALRQVLQTGKDNCRADRYTLKNTFK